jgi:hypothetical protein
MLSSHGAVNTQEPENPPGHPSIEHVATPGFGRVSNETPGEM